MSSIHLVDFRSIKVHLLYPIEGSSRDPGIGSHRVWTGREEFRESDAAPPRP